MHVTAHRILTSLFGIALIVSCERLSLAAGGGRSGGGGGGGGSSRSSSGSYHPNTSNYRLPNNFRQGTGNFIKPNGSTSGSFPHNNNFWKGGGQNFKANPNQFNKFSPQKFSKNKSAPYWKKYAGWGKWHGPWHRGFGWGWGVWLDPWCVWPWYEVIPVVEYVNVYTDCAGPVVDGIDYSVPIARMPADTLSGDDSESFAAARAAFLQGDFNTAVGATSQAIVQIPHNRDLHQFHSLALFAMKDYCRSATVAYAVLEDGPGWSWDTLQSCYPSADVYTDQLRGLEQYISANSTDANVRCLLAYHYLMLDHPDAARRQFAQVVALRPADKLAGRILAALSDNPPPNTIAARATVSGPSTGPITGPISGPVTGPVTGPLPDPVAGTVTTRTTITGSGNQATVKREQKAPALSQLPASEPPDFEGPASGAPLSGSPVSGSPASGPPTSGPSVSPPPASGPPASETSVSQAQASPALDTAPPAASTSPPAVTQTSVGSPLTGTWKANPEKKVQIELALLDDGRFKWKFTANGRAKDFSGKYKLSGSALTLTRDLDGDAMVGTIERSGGTGFRFRMNDADPDDPGLSFNR